MEHFWKGLHGCFTFSEFYRFVALEAHADWHGVEVGALYGQSAACMAVELINAGRDARFDLVELSDNIDVLWRNLETVRGQRIGAILSPLSSVEASKRYEDSSLNFVMLDAGHEYADLRSDIDAWWPKVKVSGILATHDFCHYFPGLMRAWMETFSRFNVWPGSLWPEDHDARPEARADLVNRSALHKDTDYMPVAWVRK